MLIYTHTHPHLPFTHNSMKKKKPPYSNISIEIVLLDGRVSLQRNRKDIFYARNFKCLDCI